MFDYLERRICAPAPTLHQHTRVATTFHSRHARYGNVSGADSGCHGRRYAARWPGQTRHWSRAAKSIQKWHRITDGWL